MKATAAGSQGTVKSELDSAGVTYKAFWATNAIYVEKGSIDLALTVAARPEVAGLYNPVKYEIPKVTPAGGDHAPNVVEWGIDNINANDVWDQFGVTGEGVVVANIDTGVQFDHPALVNQYRGNNGDGTFDHNYNWFDAAGTCGDAPCDGNGHGTHTMGTMVGDDGAGNQIGVAPGAKWIAANGCCPSDEALIESGEWMLEPTDLNGENPDASKRPNIINNSWGFDTPVERPVHGGRHAWPGRRRASSARGRTATVGPRCQTSGSPGSRIINYSVGAYDINNMIASFSGRGAGQDGEIKPNISAPGVNVRSSVPGRRLRQLQRHVDGLAAHGRRGRPRLVGGTSAAR